MSSWVSGIDIGHMAIRAVVMRRVKGQWQLHEYGQVDRFYGGTDKSLRQELLELTTKVALKGPVYVSDSSMNIMVRFITSVPLPDDRLRRLVRLDLQQHADDGGDLAADMMVLPIGGEDVVVCCPLAQPVQVRELLFELKRSKISAQAICLPAATTFNAMRHAFIKTNEDGHPQYNLLLDIGAKQTRLILSRDDDFLACRTLPFGGWDFTEALTANESRSVREAEKLKVSGLAAKSSIAAFSSKSDGSKGSRGARKNNDSADDTIETHSPDFDDSE
ncbi:MAG: hypothetical protein HRU15_14165 [Planctomycetes bacterium]|nr:hypothetical protein [Planctomycetota bacterium]